MVRNRWQEPISGNGMFGFAAKLRHLQGVLKHWNTTVFGNLFENIKGAEARVRHLENRHTRPLQGQFKVNIDRSSFGNPGCSGGGIVVRDSEANIILAASHYFDTGTSLRAEVLALRDALDIYMCYA